MSKVYDCVMFWQELDMLELRFNILDDAVDYFVVCEAEETHSGHPKPLNFLENYDRFKPWRDKIIYVNAGTLSDGKRTSWERERFHRSKIAEGLTGAQPDDWIIVGDCDEIPNPTFVQALRWYRHHHWVKFELDMYYYDLNHKVNQGWAIGAAQWGSEKDPNKIRTSAEAGDLEIYNGYRGWHFSYFGGAQQIVEKVKAFMHADDPIIRDLPRDLAFVASRVEAGLDLYGRDDMRIVRVPLSDTLPRYLLDNIEKYRAMGWCE